MLAANTITAAGRRAPPHTNYQTLSCNTHACPTPHPTPYPTPFPTPFPTPHPCDDGSHGCDTPNGICYEESGNGWYCGCKGGYWCSNGCSKPHTAHTCTLITPSPTPYPTPQPTASPTNYPTHAPTAYPTPQPTASPTNYPTHAPTAAPTPHCPVT